MPVAAAGDAVVLRGVQARGVGDVQQRLVLLVQQAPHTQRLRHDMKFDLTHMPCKEAMCGAKSTLCHFSS